MSQKSKARVAALSSRNPWTKKEDRILRVHYGKQRADDLMSALPGRTRYAILERAKTLRITRAPDSDWTKRELSALARVYPKHGVKGAMAELPGRRMQAIYAKAFKLGLTAPKLDTSLTKKEERTLASLCRQGVSIAQIKATALPARGVASLMKRAKEMGLEVNQRNEWSDAELAQLRKVYCSKGMMAAREALPARSASSLQYMIRQMKLRVGTKRKPTPFSEREVALIRSHFPKGGVQAVSVHLPVRDTRSIAQKARALGITRLPSEIR